MTIEKKLRGVLVEKLEFPEKVQNIYKFGKKSNYLTASLNGKKFYNIDTAILEIELPYAYCCLVAFENGNFIAKLDNNSLFNMNANKSVELPIKYFTDIRYIKNKNLKTILVGEDLQTIYDIHGTQLYMLPMRISKGSFLEDDLLTCPLLIGEDMKSVYDADTGGHKFTFDNVLAKENSGNFLSDITNDKISEEVKKFLESKGLIYIESQCIIRTGSKNNKELGYGGRYAKIIEDRRIFPSGIENVNDINGPVEFLFQDTGKRAFKAEPFIEQYLGKIKGKHLFLRDDKKTLYEMV